MEQEERPRELTKDLIINVMNSVGARTGTFQLMEFFQKRDQFYCARVSDGYYRIKVIFNDKASQLLQKGKIGQLSILKGQIQHRKEGYLFVFQIESFWPFNQVVGNPQEWKHRKINLSCQGSRLIPWDHATDSQRDQLVIPAIPSVSLERTETKHLAKSGNHPCSLQKNGSLAYQPLNVPSTPQRGKNQKTPRNEDFSIEINSHLKASNSAQNRIQNDSIEDKSRIWRNNKLKFLLEDNEEFTEEVAIEVEKKNSEAEKEDEQKAKEEASESQRKEKGDEQREREELGEQRRNEKSVIKKDRDHLRKLLEDFDSVDLGDNSFEQKNESEGQKSLELQDQEDELFLADSLLKHLSSKIKTVVPPPVRSTQQITATQGVSLSSSDLKNRLMQQLNANISESSSDEQGLLESIRAVKSKKENKSSAVSIKQALVKTIRDQFKQALWIQLKVITSMNLGSSILAILRDRNGWLLDLVYSTTTTNKSIQLSNGSVYEVDARKGKLRKCDKYCENCYELIFDEDTQVGIKKGRDIELQEKDEGYVTIKEVAGIYQGGIVNFMGILGEKRFELMTKKKQYMQNYEVYDPIEGESIQVTIFSEKKQNLELEPNSIVSMFNGKVGTYKGKRCISSIKNRTILQRSFEDNSISRRLLNWLGEGNDIRECENQSIMIQNLLEGMSYSDESNLCIKGVQIIGLASKFKYMACLECSKKINFQGQCPDCGFRNDSNLTPRYYLAGKIADYTYIVDALWGHNETLAMFQGTEEDPDAYARLLSNYLFRLVQIWFTKSSNLLHVRKIKLLSLHQVQCDALEQLKTTLKSRIFI